jgi:hypothetical protein
MEEGVEILEAGPECLFRQVGTLQTFRKLKKLCAGKFKRQDPCWKYLRLKIFGANDWLIRLGKKVIILIDFNLSF